MLRYISSSLLTPFITLLLFFITFKLFEKNENIRDSLIYLILLGGIPFLSSYILSSFIALCYRSNIILILMLNHILTSIIAFILCISANSYMKFDTFIFSIFYMYLSVVLLNTALLWTIGLRNNPYFVRRKI